MAFLKEWLITACRIRQTETKAKHMKSISLQILTFDTGLLLVAPESKVGSAGPESLDAPRGGHQHPVAEEVARVGCFDQGRVTLKTVIRGCTKTT